MDPRSDEARLKFFGRRKGRSLKPSQQGILDQRLPVYALDPEAMPKNPRELFIPSVDSVQMEIGFGSGEHLVAQAQASLPLLLGSFVLASSLASAVSATVWGYMADTSSRNVMVRGGGLAALVCLLAGGLAAWGPQTDWLHWLYPLAFFVLAIAHAGVRIGRKTYMVDMAGGNKRTDYTAVSNTVIGFLLLAVGGISAGVAMLGNDWALLVLGMMGATGVVSARLLKEV